MIKHKNTSTSVLIDSNDICHALVGLKDVKILFYQRTGPTAGIAIEQVFEEARCGKCNSIARVKERPWVEYIDLPVFGTPFRLRWKKHRMQCRNSTCEVKSWTLTDHRIAAKDCLLTTRAAKWATKQVGRGRTVNEVAKELRCDWEVVNNAVATYGKALLEADHKRLNKTEALGLDETLFNKTGEYKTKQWCTSVVDVGNHQLIDILPSRNYVDVAGWIDKQPQAWKARVAYGTLDMSPTYAAVFSVMLPKAKQVVDRFHCIQLANRALDTVRRRVQQEQLSHRGRKDDPLYRARKLLLMSADKLSKEMAERVETLLALGDPGAEVSLAYRAKEFLRDFYDAKDFEVAKHTLCLLQEQCTKKSMPKELQTFGRTIKKWFNKILEWHSARVSNGPTEGLNNLIKRIKRIGFGFRNFRNYRIRALLYASKPNWRVLDSIVVK